MPSYLTALERALRIGSALAIVLAAAACSPMDVGVPVDVGVLKDEITSYPVMCQVELVNGWCPRGQGLPLNWTTYKVYPDQQMVVSTSRGGSVDRLTNCAVGDRRNWKCTFDDRSGSIGFSDGRYWETTSPSSPLYEPWQRVIYVSPGDYVAHSRAFEASH